MSTRTMPTYLSSVQTQLASIMDVLAKAAVAEISQLISESSADLRLEMSRSIKENEVLRTRMKVMKSELFALRLQKTNATRAGRFSFSKALCRPRSRLAVLDKTDRPGRSSPITITEDERHPTPNKIESTDVESNNCPDVILIKEEDGPEDNFREHGGTYSREAWSQMLSQSHPRHQAEFQNGENVAQSVAMGMPELSPSSLMLGEEGPCIISVHGGDAVEDAAAWAAQENSPFTQPDPQRFPGLASIHAVNHGSQSQQGPDVSRATMPGMQGSREAQRRGGAAGIVDEATILATSTEMTPTSSNLARYEGWRLGLDVRPAQPLHSQSPLACSFCDKRFYRRSDLARHRTIHTGEVPITCHLCGKQFVNKTTLNVHMRIHTGEKPFVCSLCGKSFTQNGSLKIHLRTHSGEKPYSCSRCGANFNNPSNLRRHMVTHTDEGNMGL